MSNNQREHELRFYPSRSATQKMFLFFLLMTLMAASLFLFCLILASGIFFIRVEDQLLFIRGMQILMAICSLPALFLLVLVSRSLIFTFRRLISPKPTLLITSQGITVSDIPSVGTTTLAWSTIASLSVIPVSQSFGRPNWYLCIDPKNIITFLSPYHPLQRFFIRLNTVATGMFINIPPWFLSQHPENVLSQIQATFHNELQLHDIPILDLYNASAYRETTSVS